MYVWDLKRPSSVVGVLPTFPLAPTLTLMLTLAQTINYARHTHE
jgi:hypothetical protein